MADKNNGGAGYTTTEESTNTVLLNRRYEKAFENVLRCKRYKYERCIGRYIR